MCSLEHTSYVVLTHTRVRVCYTGGLHSPVWSDYEDAPPASNIDLPSWVKPGARVQLPFHDNVQGMIVKVTVDAIEVATEALRWVIITHGFQQRYVKEVAPTRVELSFASVMGFTYEGKKQQAVSGMLVGACNLVLLAGQVTSHFAHYVRPRKESRDDMRLRDASTVTNVEKHELQSFAIGDLVQQQMPPRGKAAAHAVVLRVLYTCRVGRSQARKFLVLAEAAQSSESGEWLPCAPLAIFPGSWGNWERVPSKDYFRGTSTWHCKTDRDSSNASCVKLTEVQLMSLETVCMQYTTIRFRLALTVSTAFVFRNSRQLHQTMPS